MKTKLFKLTMTLAVTFSLSTAYIVPAMAVEENNSESIQLNTVDKSNLERLINQYDYDALLAQEGYPMYQKQEIKDALENANTVYNNPNVTQEEVDNAYHRLNNAVNNYDRYLPDSQIEDLITEAELELKMTAVYTVESLAKLQEAYDNLMNVMDSNNRDEIDRLAKILAEVSAYQLDEKMDKERLLYEITSYEYSLSFFSYTAESKATFDNIMAEIKAIYNDPNATNEEILDAYIALINAFDDLVLSPDNDYNKIITIAEAELQKTNVHSQRYLNLLSTTLNNLKAAISNGEFTYQSSLLLAHILFLGDVNTIPGGTPDGSTDTTKPATETKPVDNTVTSVKTGDDIYFMPLVATMMLAGLGITLSKKYREN